MDRVTLSSNSQRLTDRTGESLRYARRLRPFSSLADRSFEMSRISAAEEDLQAHRYACLVPPHLKW